MKSAILILSFTGLLLMATPAIAQSDYTKLRPSSDYSDRDVNHTPVKISRLSQNRKLASVGDTLYMLDARNRIVWSWTSGGAPLTALPIIDSNGTMYVIGYDLLWAALDSATGKEKWRGTANGRAVYSQMKLYKRNKYLVVTDMEGYRDILSDKTIKDYLTLCKGNAILWETRIPVGAKVRVQGNSVIAYVRRKHRITKREIQIPRSFGKPIGKVSELADYE